VCACVRACVRKEGASEGVTLAQAEHEARGRQLTALRSNAAHLCSPSRVAISAGVSRNMSRTSTSAPRSTSATMFAVACSDPFGSPAATNSAHALPWLQLGSAPASASAAIVRSRPVFTASMSGVMPPTPKPLMSPSNARTAAAAASSGPSRISAVKPSTSMEESRRVRGATPVC
jgi:hypothetical protein